ncbi:adenylate cyclase [Arenibacter palladensis]|uniref:Adenylate cyclase n=1 Tax=Arenibacter palladensis TaxID=237373 RepID=A0A1M5F5B0_9FLAO|nr:adenylate/guanylate cyclase domain-containing protein [Arenibacter palladensis]MDO6605626.1 adenylate/guanylate cyclase domain-containing protein [Arenibacter palladensis]SHF86635.1 adenylate cyclase [Arenibacter palladensis]|tara:strand:+ start:14638 stop:15762 length:1125 start_codon:yes stop_codon:yes gene_type:complete
MRTLLFRKSVLGLKEIQKILIITLCWALVQSVFYIYRYFSTMEFVHLHNLTESFEFWPNFMANLFFSIFIGLIGGTILVYGRYEVFGQKYFEHCAIGSGLLFVLWYLLLAFIGLFLLGLVFYNLLGESEFAFAHSVYNLMAYLSVPSFFATMIIWGLLFSSTQFVLQINDKLGQGVLWSFLTGKYIQPREEERIFMFLDLKGSTSIAEKMESGKFFEMLKEIYKDITRPIVESLGEIYQYVGDEVVISWPVEKGIRNNNALHCFYRIERTIEEKKSKYLEKYGVVPTFKAGLHLGKATTGEIGVIKKDIVYSGDVLNTTSRIQALCNQYDVKILVSSALLQLMKLSAKYMAIPIGEISLRGKEQKIDLNTILVN